MARWDVGARLDDVREALCGAWAEGTRAAPPPHLVAVSKGQPVEAILRAHEHGQRRFGESYLSELQAKASQVPPDVQWHYIGPLQSNKIRALVAVPGLCVVESLASERHAVLLERALCALGARLTVLIQVNVSGEAQKGGTRGAEEALALASCIARQCPHLALGGLMAIAAEGAAPDELARQFGALSALRAHLAECLRLDAASLALSMGMSGDFCAAIRAGSTSVRIGGLIFGPRATPS